MLFIVPIYVEAPMKLFFRPGACSLAAHITLIETGMPYELVKVGRAKQTSDGRDFLQINPKGYVPAIEREHKHDRFVMTESLAILVYIAHESAKLLPEDGPVRWTALEALAYMTTEIHGNFKPLWRKAPQADQDQARVQLTKHFGIIAAVLGPQNFLAGPKITIADPYLYVMLRWANHHGIEVPQFDSYFAGMKKRPAVAQALAQEGLPS
jgi:glutathione S-transferase